MEQTIKRMVSFLLAVIMLVSVSPFLAGMVSAASVDLTGVSDLGVTYTATTNCSVTNGNNSLTIKAKTSPETSSGCSTTPETTRTQTVTLKNNKTGNAILTFSYAVTLSEGSVSIDGTDITAGGSFTKELAAGGTVVLSVTSGSTSDDSVLEVSDIFLVSNVSATVTFKTAQNGTYTVNDVEITEETQMTNHASVPYRLAATPASGYRLMDWYNETTDLAISVETAVEAYFDTNCTVYPRFILADAPVFMVGTVKYTDLNDANSAATKSSTNKTIILVDGGTLPAGDYTISSGVTLLVPFNDANLAITNSNIKSNYEKYKESTPSVEYRRLTLASGANITVNGCVNVSSRVYCMSNGQSGPYGLIRMESGSSMSFGSGATLQCFGYIMGTGNVVLNPGAKAYGSIFCADYPGSSTNVTTLKNAKAFPFSKYSAKNVQAPLTIYHGAEMQLYLNLYGTVAGYNDAWVKFVGDTTSYLFSTANTGDYVTVSFQNERQIVRVHGTASINTLSLTVSGISASTNQMSGLPIPYNFDICIDSGSTVNVNENLICSKGSTITVEKEATVVIPQNKSVYVMDGSDDVQAVGTQPDATLDVNGTIEVYGKLMTTSNKANVISSEGTGEIKLMSDIAEDANVAVPLKKSGSAAQSVTAYPASLKKPDGTYIETAGATAGTNIGCSESGGGWVHEHHYVMTQIAPTCTEAGRDVYTCDFPGCGDSYNENEQIALGHDYVNHTAQAPTCTAVGWDAYQTCSRCDYTTKVEISALDHDYVSHEAKAPTCTAVGWNAYQTCSRCDYTTKVEIPALDHDYVSHEAKAPTCTAAGWNAYQTCSRCEYTTYAELPALDHDLIDHEAKAATCTEAGWNAYQTCSRCDYTTYAEIPALSHDYVNHEAKAATCTEAGWDAYQTCSRCDYTTKVEIPALGHDIITDAAATATCTAAGLTAGEHCTRCDYTAEQTATEALGHDFKDGFCSRCGMADPSNTFFKINSAKLALAEDIIVVYSATVPDTMTDVYMEFVVNGATYNAESSGKDANGRLEFRLTSITPDMMGDNICATLRATTADGKKVFAVKESYSILQYCENTIRRYPDNEPLQTLLADILVYGAACQEYTGHNADKPVTEGIDTSKASSFTPPSLTDFELTGAADPAYGWISAGLQCGSKIAMFFTLHTATPETTTVEVTINDRTYTYNLANAQKNAANNYKIIFQNFNATEFGEIATVVMKNNGVQVGQTLTYSVNSYVCSMQNDGNEKLANLVRAIYNYGESAKKYIGK